MLLCSMLSPIRCLLLRGVNSTTHLALHCSCPAVPCSVPARVWGCCYAESTAPHKYVPQAFALKSPHVDSNDRRPGAKIGAEPAIAAAQVMVGGVPGARTSVLKAWHAALAAAAGSAGRPRPLVAFALGVTRPDLAQARAVVAAADACASRGRPGVFATVHASVLRTEEGPCTVDSAGCVASPNYPFDDGSSDYCRISISPAAPVIVRELQVGSDYDMLELDGQRFSPTALLHYLSSVSNVAWSTDASVSQSHRRVLYDCEKCACDGRWSAGPARN